MCDDCFLSVHLKSSGNLSVMAELLDERNAVKGLILRDD